MFNDIKSDFRRFYHHTTYKGKWHKIMSVLGNQGFEAIFGYRISRWLMQKHIPFIPLFIQRFIEITTGISIPPDTKIGPGLMIMHFGGIIINSQTVIGQFCTITHGVTIGNKNPGGKSPVIGNHVRICAGAKVLGDILIGDYSVIGANAVVIKTLPPNSIAAGVPAKVIKTIKNIEFDEV